MQKGGGLRGWVSFLASLRLKKNYIDREVEMVQKIIMIIVALLAINACAGEIGMDREISYLLKPDSDYAAEQCKLDVFYPKGVDDFATIVWFHGGGLRMGQRQWGELVAERFLPEEIAVVTVSYRFSPKVKNPVYIEDAAAAIAWTFKNIMKYGGDPDKIFLSGHSAGGYLTLITGMDKRYLAKYDISSDRIAGLIPISGQTITHSTIRRERGIPEGKQLVDEYAALFYANKVGPPCLCICGSKDLPLRSAENIYFVEVQKAAGNKNVSFLEVEGRDHDAIFENINQPGDEVATAMSEFIKKILIEENK
jgi:acetyl esterase/lipase